MLILRAKEYLFCLLFCLFCFALFFFNELSKKNNWISPVNQNNA